MQIALGFFGVAFILMTITGYVSGSRAMHGAPMTVATAIRAVTIETDGLTTYFVYRQRSQVRFKWDVEHNRFITVPNSDALSAALRPSLPFPLSGSHIVYFAGGSAATWKLKDLLSVGNAATKRDILASILGSISGYALGYKLATLRLPHPDSDEVARIAAEPTFWSANEARIFFAAWKPVYLRAGLMKEADPARMAEAELMRILDGLDMNDGGVTAADISALVEVEASVGTADVKPLFDPLANMPWWLSWWFIVPCILGSAAICMVAAHVVELLQEHRKRLEQKPLIIIP
jgi:hypothetical protein